MQANDPGGFAVVEMAVHCPAHVATQLVEGVRFGEDRFPQGAGAVAAFGRFGDQEDDPVHARCAPPFCLPRSQPRPGAATTPWSVPRPRGRGARWPVPRTWANECNAFGVRSY